MSKVISEKVVEASSVEQPKMVEIKHTRVMKDADGNDVTVLDYVETRSVDEAIAEAESRKASLESSLAEVDSELSDLNAIKG
jgi:L-serine deaminase|tara:strand:+ start:507 stop:752 length:246 start_codon:yes stop_codon:yes gene_type:complete